MLFRNRHISKLINSFNKEAKDSLRIFFVRIGSIGLRIVNFAALIAANPLEPKPDLLRAIGDPIITLSSVRSGYRLIFCRPLFLFLRFNKLIEVLLTRVIQTFASFILFCLLNAIVLMEKI